MNVWDNHAQASSILQPLDLMDERQVAYAIYRWGRITESHRCWSLVQKRILASIGTAVSHRRGIDKLMRNFRGEKIGRDQLVRSLQCQRDELPRWKERVYRPLQALHADVYGRFEARVEWLGVVE